LPDGHGIRLSERRGGRGQPKVLAQKVAITLEACHAVENFEQALTRYGVPDIVNTDQGSHGWSRNSASSQVVWWTLCFQTFFTMARAAGEYQYVPLEEPTPVLNDLAPW
jgi:hypothetical protein